ncbi:MAG TPA: GH25 family lysozyme [Polyangiaceae bacterium]|nr:GH25 family lysozyme [Polyangiaceae bacterium]
MAVALTFFAGCSPAPSDDVQESQSALAVCAGPATVQGLDVSYYQGAVDWGAVYGAGYRFGIARVSDGLSHPDERFDENWTGMATAGFVRGAYQYFEPSEDAVEQAALVVREVGRLGPLDLPVALDAETTGDVALVDLVPMFRAWLAAVESGTGKRPILYTASYFWNTLADADLSDHALWVSSYPATCPDVPSIFRSWTFWQKGTDHVPGISPAVDVDEFDGSLGELLAFAKSRIDRQVVLDGGAADGPLPHPSDEHMLPGDAASMPDGGNPELKDASPRKAADASTSVPTDAARSDSEGQNPTLAPAPDRVLPTEVDASAISVANRGTATEPKPGCSSTSARADESAAHDPPYACFVALLLLARRRAFSG